MLSQIHRFHGRAGLRSVYSKGKTVRQADFALRYLPTNRQTGYRCAIVVSKKTVKKAVGRNRIRRRIYSLIRTLMADNDRTYDFIVTVFNPGIATMTHQQLSQELTDLLKKAGIL